MNIKLAVTKIFHRYPVVRLFFLLAGDFSFIIISVTLGFLLRFDGIIPSQYLAGPYQGAIGLLLLFTIPIFVLFRLYSFSWSYVSISELMLLASAVALSFSFAGLALIGFRESPIFLGFPRSILLISAILFFFFSGGVRFAKRIAEEVYSLRFRKKGVRTLIVGAGDAGAQLARNIAKSSTNALVGFVDDNQTKFSHAIHGIRVLGGIEDIPSIVSAYKIEEIIIALPSAGSQPIKRAVELGRESKVERIKIVPPLSEIINGEVSLRAVREVRVEDLLGRNLVSLDFSPIERFISGQSVLITGAAGSIGSELSRQVSRFSPSCLILVDQDETGIFHIMGELKEKFPALVLRPCIADIRDEEKMRSLLNNTKPSLLFHAAAYKHVPLMEANPDEAIKNNVFGTLALADASLKAGVEKFIFISTDKAVNPKSIMGATKRIGEIICQVCNQKNHTRFISVRFGNVLASRGSVISIFQEQIKRGGPVTVTHPDMKRYFMSTSEACLLVMLAGAIGEGGEIYVLNMGAPIKIIDLAHELIRLSGFKPDVEIPIVFTGPRSGEKLFEELMNKEEVFSTWHEKIFRSKLAPVNEEELEYKIETLRKATVHQ
ncbi:MAG: polysaccharide biosynthesis protein [Candidatus Wildermuthbacteria bacterium]|nr:polysaccharide biosynthesis protein [Candidatus Wildermuthbacteria bacterium]